MNSPAKQPEPWNAKRIRRVLKKAIGVPRYLYVQFLNIFNSNPVYLWLFRNRIVKNFNKLYYYLRKNTFDHTYFMGKHVLKFPTDLWTYQEIIFEKKPDVIVETGMFLGGSTYFFAQLCKMFGKGRVIAIDITLDHLYPELYELDNVTILRGSTSDPETLARVRALIQPHETVMVALDSAHESDHVFKEIQLFSQLVTEGQYLVVEDGIIADTYPIVWNKGPYHAIKKFLKSTTEFIPDYYRNRFLLTHNKRGYLLKTQNKAEVIMPNYNDTLRPLRLWLPYLPAFNDMRWLKSLNQNLERSEKEKL